MARLALPILVRAAAVLFVARLAGALAPISVKGTKFYDQAGNQFFIKGVAYSSGNIRMDPLLDTDQCQIDAGLMKAMGVNTIRVYTVDGSQKHDGCMQAFASQGIYVGLDLPNPVESINRNTPSWTKELYTNWTGTVDAFAGYDNLLFFNIGNEVISDAGDTTAAAPYIKAATRDIKAFRNARGYRPIPVGYSAADNALIRNTTANYLACGDEEDTVEFYGMNIYSWCGNSSYYISGYDKLYEQFQHLNIPVIFSETGCKPDSGHRDFSEVSTMLGPVFQALFSGVVVYEWTMEANGYGLVEYSNSRNTGFPGTLGDYNALATVYSTANPTGTARTAYTPSNSAPSCPGTTTKVWSANPDAALPTINGLEISTVTARTTYTAPQGQETGGSSSTGSSTRSNSSASGDPNAGETASSSGGLSTGAIAGVAVGAIVGVLGGAALIFLLIRKRRARELSEKGLGGGLDGNGSQGGFKAELPAQSVGVAQARQEMDASGVPRQPHEYYGEGYKNPDETAAQAVAGQPPVHEMAVADQHHFHEMEGSYPAAGMPTTTHER
ncbi:hypothetical protein GQ53DRAFT_710648 [Thozetella sp. PMI_491]|nr:hypothetical protein GQ53DRAFT_710648 [Thozetella sp. PMI_491]